MTTKHIHKYSVNVSMLVILKGDVSTAETVLQEGKHLQCHRRYCVLGVSSAAVTRRTLY